MARDILAELGLSKDKIKALLPQPVVIVEPTVFVVQEHSDLCRSGDDLKNSIARLRANETWIVAEFVSGRSAPEIALLLGVCTESVHKRLRKLGYYGNRGRGKPKEKIQPLSSPLLQASQRIYRVEPTDCSCQ
jgi:hypothetical protein